MGYTKRSLEGHPYSKFFDKELKKMYAALIQINHKVRALQNTKNYIAYHKQSIEFLQNTEISLKKDLDKLELKYK